MSLSMRSLDSLWGVTTIRSMPSRSLLICSPPHGSGSGARCMDFYMYKKWTEFVGRPNRAAKTVPRVTLNCRGVLLLNGLVFEALGAPAAVKLFYNEDAM